MEYEMTKLKEIKMHRCNFCGRECDGKNVIRSEDFRRFDGGDVIVCNECLNDYTNYDFDKLIEKLKKWGKECSKQ